jgi:hypothetical protein
MGVMEKWEIDGKSQNYVSALSRLALARGTRSGELIRKSALLLLRQLALASCYSPWRVQQDQHHLFLLLKPTLSLGKLSLNPYYSSSVDYRLSSVPYPCSNTNLLSINSFDLALVLGFK